SSKRRIKSGGEWISSVDMENIVTSHPAVKMAAVIGIPHPKWDERPLLLVTINEDHEILSQDLKDFISQRSAKWEVPDEIIFVDQIPLGATGKIDKKTLREHYVTNWDWPD
ncbi:MAG: long-chain fatty acid--CoA ligase, partial [Paraglaciecola sp.]|nr:long-chain fatty acid--CoA ligase [Paraglaciecola sp.]